MSVTITFQLWWLGAYLAVGLLLYVPLNWYAHRHTSFKRDPFWPRLWRTLKRDRFVSLLVQVVAWPLAVWEDFR